MKQGDKFRHAEKCLYDYKKNLACLNVLRDDLKIERSGSDVHAQNYQYTFGFTGEPSNPVQARLIKIENLEARISQLERYTKPITLLIGDLNAPEVLDGSNNKIMSEILRLFYFGNNQPFIIMEELKISRSIFYLRRRELVRTAIMYLGF